MAQEGDHAEDYSQYDEKLDWDLPGILLKGRLRVEGPLATAANLKQSGSHAVGRELDIMTEVIIIPTAI
jgi:hypothetical protein